MEKEDDVMIVEKILDMRMRKVKKQKETTDVDEGNLSFLVLQILKE